MVWRHERCCCAAGEYRTACEALERLERMTQRPCLRACSEGMQAARRSLFLRQEIEGGLLLQRAAAFMVQRERYSCLNGVWRHEECGAW